MKYLSSIFVCLVLGGCTGQPERVSESNRSYAPCTTVNACAVTVRDVITMNWINPRPTRNAPPLSVLLSVELNDDAQLESVTVVNSSGDAAFDESAIHAVRGAKDFRELRGLDLGTFKKYFKNFHLNFAPNPSQIYKTYD